MSTNPKNIIRPEYLKNFTKNIKRRNVIVESGKHFNFDLQNVINSVNTKINQIIQQLNIKITFRQIPYITLTIKYKPELDEDSRIIIRNLNTSDCFSGLIKEQAQNLGINMSHCIEILSAPGYKEVVISSLEYDAEIVISQVFLECAIIDVLLDIVMFNSYSFLAEKSMNSKHGFSYEKYSFYKSNNLKCFYEYKTSKDLYYSFAFSARINEQEFDIDKYINLWDSFISQNYGDCIHIEPSISKQLKQHVDYEELPNNLYKRFTRKPEGSYLVLRTNKDRTESIHPHLLSFFNLDEYQIGKIKIIPMEQIGLCLDMLKNLDVSAFKIVKSKTANHVQKKQKDKNKTTITNKTNVQVSAPSKKTKRFKIALSFPGEYREKLVFPIAEKLSELYGKESILYDKYIEDELAVCDSDLVLKDFFAKESELIVVFACNSYDIKKWCGIEWRAIRDLIYNNQSKNRVMFIKCDKEENVEMLSGTTGYLDAETHSIDELVDNINSRYNKINIKE